jgi:hypothetical protein
VTDIDAAPDAPLLAPAAAATATAAAAGGLDAAPDEPDAISTTRFSSLRVIGTRHNGQRSTWAAQPMQRQKCGQSVRQPRGADRHTTHPLLLMASEWSALQAAAAASASLAVSSASWPSVQRSRARMAPSGACMTPAPWRSNCALSGPQ